MSQKLCDERVQQWDELSVDSGFSSDVEKNNSLLTPRKTKTKTLYNELEYDFQTQIKSKNNSLPLSFRLRDELLPINWEEVSLNDFYHVRRLGGGGYSKVDLLQYSRSDRKDYFALKKISKQCLVEPKQAKQFEAEKEILCNSRSKFIPCLFKAFHSTNHVYLLTEACLGGDLFSYLENFGPQKLESTRFVIACVIEALDYLHRILHVIHRDVKTENLLIGRKGIVKLADFGFCKTLIATDSPKTFTFCGTPGYIAPEVILHTGHSFSVDYFSLGVVLYEVISCRSPFRREATIDTYKATLKGIKVFAAESDIEDEVAFPANADQATRSFISQLCQPDPDQRLCHEARTHEWFCGFDWQDLKSGQMTSPLAVTET